MSHTSASPSPWTVYGALVFVQVSFAVFYIVGKLIMVSIPPMTFAGLRIILSTPLLLVLAWSVDRQLPRLRDLPYLAFLGFFGVCFNQLTFITGLQLSRATDTAILITSIPVFTALIGGLFRIERMNRWKLAGIGMAVSGALVVLNLFAFRPDPQMLLGNLLILVNCLSYAVFLVFQRPILRRLPPLSVLAWSFVFGGAGVLLWTWRDVLTFDAAVLNTGLVLGMVFAIGITTVANYFLNSWAIRYSAPSLAATFVTLQPLAAAPVAALVLGEPLGQRHIVGFLMTVAGIGLVTKGRELPQAPPLLTPPPAEVAEVL